QTGSMKKAISEVGKILNIKGKVVPVTFTKESKLCVDLVDGETIVGETHIDEVELKKKRAEIKKVYLKPTAVLNVDAKEAIKHADYIVIGPGDLFTSILPNILVKGVSLAIKNSKAKKIYVMNLMTKYGQTTKFKASDHINALEKYLGKNILDYILVNNKKPKKQVLSWYQEYEEYPVEDDLDGEYKIIRKDLLKDVIIEQNPSDARRRSIIRHDSRKLAQEVMNLIK
nr:YvcK family protein [Candidatus Levybacteria bacterium]